MFKQARLEVTATEMRATRKRRRRRRGSDKRPSGRPRSEGKRSTVKWRRSGRSSGRRSETRSVILMIFHFFFWSIYRCPIQVQYHLESFEQKRNFFIIPIYLQKHHKIILERYNEIGHARNNVRKSGNTLGQNTSVFLSKVQISGEGGELFWALGSVVYAYTRARCDIVAVLSCRARVE